MPHVLGVRTTLLPLCLFSCATISCGKDQISGPQAEVKKSDVKVDLPTVPAFDLPPAPGDGSHAVKELRVKGKKPCNTAVSVHRVITWAEECPPAVPNVAH